MLVADANERIDHAAKCKVSLVDGFPYLDRQRDALHSLISKIPSAVDEGEAWIIKRTDLGHFAERSRFEDPEQVVMWRSPEKPIADDNFIRAYCAWDRSMIGKPALAALVFDSFCRFMQHWLLNKQQPVSLGFAQLFAMQARANWKAAILVKLVNRVNGIKGWHKTADMPTGELQAKLLEFFMSSRMTALDVKAKCLRWTIDVAPTEEFHRTCQALEEEKRASGHYFQRVEDQLKRQVKYAYQILRAHALETSRPMLLLPHDGVPERLADLSRKEFTKFLDEAKESPPSDVESPVVLDRSSRVGGLVDVVPADALLSALPDLSARCATVRERGENLAEPEHGDHGVAGLPVRDVREGAPESELLAGGADRGENGLGGGIEQRPVLEKR